MSDDPNDQGPQSRGSAAATAPAPPKSSYSQDVRSIAIETPLGKDVLLLRGLKGEEGISRLFRFDLDLLSEQPSVDIPAIIGKGATAGIRLADGTDRFINGIVSRIAVTGSEGRFTTYRAELVPWTWLLTRTSDCRTFQNLSIPAIIEKVFKDLGFLDFSNRLQKRLPPREYTVQYRETDFNFISRLMEHCGIFYFFEHENGKHTFVLADSEIEHRPCPGLAPARFRALSPEDYEADVISGWAMAHEIRPAKYALGAYNFETPNANLAVNVESIHGGDASTKYEIYDYPGDYQKRDEGESLVGLRIEEQEAQVVTIHGTSTCRTLASGYRFELAEHPHAPVNQTYVVTTVTHAVSEPSYLGKGEGAAGRYRNTFTAIPVSVPFRPPRITPRPVIHGVQTAIVVGKKGEELWVDKYGRVKVQFHWDREGRHDENSSCWIRVSQNWAGKRWGAMFLPRIGQEVIVEFLEGDPDCPIITGRVYNAEQTPPYDLPEEQTKTALKSSSSKGGGGFNELRFEDKKGSEQIFIHGQKDLDLVIESQSRELVLADRHLIVQNHRLEQVGKEQHLKVGGDLVEEIGGSRFSAAKSLFVKAGGQIVLSTDGEITLKAAGGFITLGAGGINIQGTLVNINSGGTAGAATMKPARLPHRASSSGVPGGAGLDESTGEAAAQDPNLARIELYRKAYEENSAKMSEKDRQDYEQALAELEAATARNDPEGIAAAKGKLDAILQKNGIAIPADPAVVAAVPGTTTEATDAAGTPTGPGRARLFAGPVGVSGRRFVTPDGLVFRPVFATGFALVEQVAHGREGDAIRFLDWARRTGFNGVRVLSMCHHMFKLSPSEGVAALPRMLALARERGLYAEVVALADTGPIPVDLNAHVSAVARAIVDQKNAVLQIANEHYHGTQDSRLHDVKFLNGLRSAVPAGLTYTLAPPHSDEDLEPGGMYATRHLDRGRDKWNQVRRVRELEMVSHTLGRPVLNDEPIGADEVDNPGRRFADPNFFFTLGILNRIFEVGSTFHSQDGLKAEVPRPVQQRCAEAFVAGATLVPNDVDLTFKNATWADSPVKEAAFESRVVRVYSGISGNRGWTVVVGKSGDPAIVWQNGWKPIATVTDRGPVVVLEIART